MAKPRIRTYPHYRGNHWAIVMGVKDPQIRPFPVITFVRTASKKEMLARYREQYPGRVIRAIPQPYSGIFEPGT
jgi:hypothetical protein